MNNVEMDLREIGWGGTNYTDLAQDRNQSRALVNTVMNFGFYKTLEIPSVDAQLAAVQEGLSSIESVSQSVSQSVSWTYILLFRQA
jgi:hypothetical protein